jgi:hypothetical protein
MVDECKIMRCGFSRTGRARRLEDSVWSVYICLAFSVSCVSAKASQLCLYALIIRNPYTSMARAELSIAPDCALVSAGLFTTASSHKLAYTWQFIYLNVGSARGASADCVDGSTWHG